MEPKECSACIEMLFADLPDYPARIHAAKAAGYAAVEFWGWRAKHLDAIAAALRETGMRLTGFVADPMPSLTDRAALASFLAALPDSIATAQRLGTPYLYIQGGTLIAGQTRTTITDTLISALTAAADALKGSGVTLLLEPVSDGQNAFLTRAADGLPIIAAVDRPEVRLLYDLYHAAVAGEDTATTIGPHMSLIGHVHVADHPGRVAPGLGALPLDRDLAWIRAQGYTGLFGLEFLPGAPT